MPLSTCIGSTIAASELAQRMLCSLLQTAGWPRTKSKRYIAELGKLPDERWGALQCSSKCVLFSHAPVTSRGAFDVPDSVCQYGYYSLYPQMPFGVVREQAT